MCYFIVFRFSFYLYRCIFDYLRPTTSPFYFECGGRGEHNQKYNTILFLYFVFVVFVFFIIATRHSIHVFMFCSNFKCEVKLRRNLVVLMINRGCLVMAVVAKIPQTYTLRRLTDLFS